MLANAQLFISQSKDGELLLLMIIVVLRCLRYIYRLRASCLRINARTLFNLDVTHAVQSIIYYHNADLK